VSSVDGKNNKGQNGRVKVETLSKGDRKIDLDGMGFQIGQAVAEELLAALSSSLRPYQGYAIFDRIQQQLDPVMDRLMAGEPAEDGRDPGRAESYTMVLAIIRNPHKADYPCEKVRQVNRWNSINEQDEDSVAE
jgi:hypothetical protein